MKMLKYIILAIGILSLIYYGVIISYSGTGSSFSWFWLLAGVFCTGLSLLMGFIASRNVSIPQPVRFVLIILVLLGISIFIFIEGLIVYHANKEPDPDMDYLIVLGAQIRGTHITNSLKKRLEASEVYLKDNPDTLVIVSGGQGLGEDISEAEAMKNYLINHGVDEDRIIVENQSKNTVENILYSKRLITMEDAKVALVTNGFHVFRAVSIANRQGISNIQGLSAPSDRILAISYYVREVLAVFKDYVFGNM